MHERRSQDVHLIATFRQIVKEELAERDDLRKNGGTWSEWRGKALTVPNIMILVTTICSIVVFIFTLGGRAVNLEASSQKAVEMANQAVESNARLMDEIGAMRKTIDAQAEMIARAESMHVTKADLQRLQDAIAQAPTRREFRRVLNEELLPRLDNIEKQRRQP